MNAKDFHQLRTLIRESGTPHAATIVAAPIRKLCPLKPRMEGIEPDLICPEIETGGLGHSPTAQYMQAEPSLDKWAIHQTKVHLYPHSKNMFFYVEAKAKQRMVWRENPLLILTYENRSPNLSLLATWGCKLPSTQKTKKILCNRLPTTYLCHRIQVVETKFGKAESRYRG